MKLKIVSDGSFLGTWVVNAETGERVDDVAQIVWHSRPGHANTATIKLLDVEVAVMPRGEHPTALVKALPPGMEDAVLAGIRFSATTDDLHA